MLMRDGWMGRAEARTKADRGKEATADDEVTGTGTGAGTGREEAK